MLSFLSPSAFNSTLSGSWRSDRSTKCWRWSLSPQTKRHRNTHGLIKTVRTHPPARLLASDPLSQPMFVFLPHVFHFRLCIWLSLFRLLVNRHSFFFTVLICLTSCLSVSLPLFLTSTPQHAWVQLHFLGQTRACQIVSHLTWPFSLY